MLGSVSPQTARRKKANKIFTNGSLLIRPVFTRPLYLPLFMGLYTLIQSWTIHACCTLPRLRCGRAPLPGRFSCHRCNACATHCGNILRAPTAFTTPCLPRFACAATARAAKHRARPPVRRPRLPAAPATPGWPAATPARALPRAFQPPLLCACQHSATCPPRRYAAPAAASLPSSPCCHAMPALACKKKKMDGILSLLFVSPKLYQRLP